MAYRWPPQKRLKLYLVEHDVSIGWLSEQTGVSEVTLSGVVTGRLRATPRVRGLIADALGRPSGVLFEHIDDPTDDELAAMQNAELLKSVQFDDETIEALRRLLFPGNGPHCCERSAAGVERGAA